MTTKKKLTAEDLGAMLADEFENGDWGEIDPCWFAPENWEEKHECDCEYCDYAPDESTYAVALQRALERVVDKINKMK